MGKMKAKEKLFESKGEVCRFLRCGKRNVELYDEEMKISH